LVYDTGNIRTFNTENAGKCTSILGNCENSVSFSFNEQIDGDFSKMKFLDAHLISVQYYVAFGKC